MADDEDLKSFKIGDHQPSAKVAKPAGATVTAKGGGPGKPQAEPETESISLGFTRIESILDKEDREEVARGLTELLAALDAFSTSATTNKDKAAAKRAIAAVELTVDLMDYLYQTKAQLETSG